MVTDRRVGMDDLKKQMAFIGANPLKFGWLARPDSFSPGTGTGGDKKKADDGRQEGVNVATVARAHELSLGNLKSVQPPRSVLNKTTEQHTVEIEEAIGDFVGPVVEGVYDAKRGLSLLGEFVIDLAKRQYVSQAGWKPLSEARKKQKIRGGKSGDKARINFGQELNSLRYQIGDT